MVAAVAANSGVMPGAVDGPPLDQRQCTLDQTVAIRIIGSGYVEPGAKSLNRLVGEGPLLVGVYMPDNFDTISAHDIFRIGHPEKVALHSMMLVGYDWAAQTITMLGSNGPLWGNGGYVTMDMTEADFFGRWPFGVTV